MTDNRITKSECKMLTFDDTHKTVRESICDLAGDRRPGETLKAMFYRVAIATGLKASRLKTLWYGECSSPAWHEVETLRNKAAQTKERREIRARWQDMGRDADLAEIRARLERLERDDQSLVMATSETCGLFETSGRSLD